MADIITAEERTEWEWLFESATAGPWTAKRRWSNECEVVPRITCTPDSDRGCGWIADLIGAPYLGHESTLPNADFIAASRLGWPRTLAALEAAEERAEKAEADLAFIHEKLTTFFSEYRAIEFGDSGETTITVSTARARLLAEVRDRLRAAAEGRMTT